MIRFAIILAFIGTGTASALVGQTITTPPPNPESTLTVTTRIVSLDAVVRDAHGQLVTNLDKSAFTLHEDGKPVPIRYFNRDTDLPVMIGLMVDTSGSQREYFDEESRASSLFFQKVLTEPKDQAFIVRFDTNVFQLHRPSSSVADLQHSLTYLSAKDPFKDTPHGGTRLFDAICVTAAQVMLHQPGRRAFVIMTDGDDNGSQNDLSTAIKYAQLADVAVYSILYTSEDPHYPHVSTLRPSGIEVMGEISRATGGREFVVGPKMPIGAIFSAIEDELRSEYRLGFTPVPSRARRFHSLDLKPIDKSLSVQSRTSYYTPEETPAPPAPPKTSTNP